MHKIFSFVLSSRNLQLLPYFSPSLSPSSFRLSLPFPSITPSRPPIFSMGPFFLLFSLRLLIPIFHSLILLSPSHTSSPLILLPVHFSYSLPSFSPTFYMRLSFFPSSFFPNFLPLLTPSFPFFFPLFFTQPKRPSVRSSNFVPIFNFNEREKAASLPRLGV